MSYVYFQAHKGCWPYLLNLLKSFLGNRKQKMLRFDTKSKKYLYFCNKFALSKEERAMNVK